MPGILALIPSVVWRWVAIIGVGAALFGYGYLRGHEAGKAAGEADLARFQASVAEEGARAAKHTQEVIAKQEAVNVSISSDYQRKLAALRSRVQQSQRPDGSAVPTFSCPAPRVDGTPTNPVLVETVPKADFDTLAGLAAQTTQQLLSLQDWVRQQQAAFP